MACRLYTRSSRGDWCLGCGQKRENHEEQSECQSMTLLDLATVLRCLGMTLSMRPVRGGWCVQLKSEDGTDPSAEHSLTAMGKDPEQLIRRLVGIAMDGRAA